MNRPDPIARLERLAAEGVLRFVYVVGVARSNSTVVCRLIGERLDGAVYEPAMPSSRDPARHYAETVLRAHDAARARVPEGAAVRLAIKDLSLFLNDARFGFIAAHADHVVFTVRDPLPQYRSLAAQFAHEFSPLQRLDALVRYPVEVGWLTWYLITYGTRFVREAAARFGFSPLNLHRLAMAGWNLRSWTAIRRQFEHARGALPADRITVFDAGVMRLLPEAATAAIEAMAAPLARGPGDAVEVEVAGHTRMYPASRWAEEALSTRHVKPLPAGAAPAPAPNAFECRMLEAFYPDYGVLFFAPEHRLRAEAPADAADRVPALRHLLTAMDAETALARLLAPRNAQPRR